MKKYFIQTHAEVEQTETQTENRPKEIRPGRFIVREEHVEEKGLENNDFAGDFEHSGDSGDEEGSPGSTGESSTGTEAGTEEEEIPETEESEDGAFEDSGDS